MRSIRRFTIFAVTATAIVLIDQLSKAAVRASFDLGRSMAVIPGVLYLTHVRNVGAAFGLLPGQRFVFIGISVFVLLVIGIYLVRQRPSSWSVLLALGLICGGAVGNLIDRVISGQVTDFFELGFFEFPVFNVADSAIFCGACVLVGWLLFSPAGADASAELTSQDEGP